MYKALKWCTDKSFTEVDVSTKEDIRSLLKASIGDAETIYLTESILLFYNFKLVSEVGHMTGKLYDKDGNLSFVCGDCIIINTDGDSIATLSDNDIDTVKEMLKN